MSLQENFTEISPDDSSGENAEPRTLKFKRAFWIIAFSIFANQIYTLILSLTYGLKTENLPSDYHFYLEIGGIIWYFIILGLVIFDIQHQGLSPSEIFNFEWSRLLEFSSEVIKYFSGCSVVVVLLSLLTHETELGLEHQSTFLIGISFLSAVIIAPIIEEFIFRGYLYTAMLPTFKREKERLVVNAMLFSAAHVFLVAFLLGVTVPYYIFVLGYFLAKLYEKSRSVLPCILLHGLNNGLVFLIDLAKLKGLI